VIYTDGTPTICSAGVKPPKAAIVYYLMDDDKPSYRTTNPHGYTFARFTDAVNNTRRFGHPDPPHLRGPRER
jgi:hypothetical protein